MFAMSSVDLEIAAILGETEPLPEPPPADLVKGEAIGEWLGISVAKVHELARVGVFPRKRAGRGNIYDLRECILSYVEHVAGSPKTEAARLAKARRIKLEVETAQLQGELVPAADVEREWSAMLTEFRGLMLSIPSRVGERLPALSLADIEVVDRAIRDALTEASGHDGDD